MSDGSRWAERSVPVVVDAVRRLEGRAGESDWARCVYFVITAEAPPTEPVPLIESPRAEQWLLRAAGLGVVGVVMRPPPSADPDPETMLFASSDLMDLVFEVEEAPGILVETDSLWIPAESLSRSPLLETQPADPRAGRSDPVERGDVYRLSLELFQQLAHDRDAEVVNDAQMLSNVRANIQGGGGIAYSPVETQAMAAWGELEIRRATEQFPKDRDLELRYQ